MIPHAKVVAPTEDVAQDACPSVRQCRKTSFRGDVLKLVSGTTIAQLLGILAAPILTRLYAPDAFGVLAVFISITSVLGVIACLRYELSIMLPEKDEDAANLLGVSLGSAILIALLIVPAIWLGKAFIVRWLNAPNVAQYLWLVPVMVLLQGVFLALNYWNSRTRHFGRLSVARVTRSVMTTCTMTGSGFVGHATGGAMIGGTVVGQAVATTVLGGQIWRDDGRFFSRAIRLSSVFSGMRRHREFPLYGTWSAFLNCASWQLPTFLLSAFFASTVVGFYALGFRILQLPMSLVGGAIGQVFFQRASLAKNNGTLPAMTEVTLHNLLKVGLFPALLLMVIGSDLFSLVFGEPWAEAGLYAQILAPWTLFLFIQSPISCLFAILEKQRSLLLCDVLTSVFRALSLILGGMLGSSVLALALFSATGTIVNLLVLIYLLSLVGCHIHGIAVDLLTRIVTIVLFLTPVVVAQLAHASARAVVSLGFVAGVAYFAFVVMRDETIRHVLLRTASVHRR